MSRPRLPAPGLLLCSVLSARWDRVWPELRQRLLERFGPLASEEGPFAFAHTSYYDGELGGPITRRLLAFSTLLPHERLAEAKLATNEMERHYSREDGRRLVNLDPGLLTLERLVLATGKNYTHRVYLSQGIWADLTLLYQAGNWRTLPWTFPDYADPGMLQRLLRLRLYYKGRCDEGLAHSGEETQE